MLPEKAVVPGLVTRTCGLWRPNVTRTSVLSGQKTRGSSILHLHPGTMPSHLPQVRHHKRLAMPARRRIGEPSGPTGSPHRAADPTNPAGRNRGIPKGNCWILTRSGGPAEHSGRSLLCAEMRHHHDNPHVSLLASTGNPPDRIRPRRQSRGPSERAASHCHGH